MPKATREELISLLRLAKKVCEDGAGNNDLSIRGLNLRSFAGVVNDKITAALIAEAEPEPETLCICLDYDRSIVCGATVVAGTSLCAYCANGHRT